MLYSVYQFVLLGTAQKKKGCVSPSNPGVELPPMSLFSPVSTADYATTLHQLVLLNIVTGPKQGYILLPLLPTWLYQKGEQSKVRTQPTVPQVKTRYQNPVLRYYQKMPNISYHFNGLYLYQMFTVWNIWFCLSLSSWRSSPTTAIQLVWESNKRKNNSFAAIFKKHGKIGTKLYVVM